MKKFFGISLFQILLFMGCSGQNTDQLKVMTWNIWHGGLHGDKASDFVEDTANTINVLKVLQEEMPDILCMQETYCCGMEIAKQAGYPYSVRGSSNLSIHSKFPIVDSMDIFRPFNSHAAVIDFIYYKGPGLKTRFSKIVMDDPVDGFFNSDHRAILSILDLGE